MNISQLLMIILIPLGVLLLLALIVYLYGNVYNGLMVRRSRVEHSWYELTKSLRKSYDLIPYIVQDVKMDDKSLNILKDIYKQYKDTDLSKASPREMAGLDKMYQEVLDGLNKSPKKNEELDYVNESRRLSQFSVPLYNHNVRDYLKFKHMLVNRKVAEMLRLDDKELFENNPLKSDSTADIRLKDYINSQSNK
jgi:hypothetical protein